MSVEIYNLKDGQLEVFQKNGKTELTVWAERNDRAVTFEIDHGFKEALKVSKGGKLATFHSLRHQSLHFTVMVDHQTTHTTKKAIHNLIKLLARFDRRA